jgi:type IV secretion system protein VirB1
MLAELILACAPALDQRLATALIRRESGFNQFAIGMDSKHSARLARQPRNLTEAVKTATYLQSNGYGFSVGLTQIHVSNIKRFALSWEQAFNPCDSLKVGEKVLVANYKTALSSGFAGQGAVFAALRGYNSGSIHAKVSNDYASAILADANGKAASPVASHLSKASLTHATPQNKTIQEYEQESNTKEMREKQ